MSLFLLHVINVYAFVTYLKAKLGLEFVRIFRAFKNMRDIIYMRDICDMLYGGTCSCILLIYPIYRAKYNKYQV